MADPRIQKFAKVLVEHSARVAPGDRVIIEATTAAEPLVRELFIQILEKGGIPVVGLMDADEMEDYLEIHDPEIRRLIELSNEDIRTGRTRPAREFLAELQAGSRPKARANHRKTA